MNKLSVLVTRPDPQGSRWCQALTALGYTAYHCPTISFAPPRDFSKAKSTMAKLGEQDWLIFISPQAVRASVPLMRQLWPVMPERVQFAAVGSGTAAALREAGYCVAAKPQEDWRTEGLLALPVFQDLMGKKIAIIRGDDGRPTLEQTLFARGGTILPIAMYQRVVNTINVDAYKLKLKQQAINAIICTSYDGVRYLKTLMGDDVWDYVRHVPLLVVSDRVMQLAKQLGFMTVWHVSQVSIEAFDALLKNKKDVLCQSNPNQ